MKIKDTKNLRFIRREKKKKVHIAGSETWTEIIIRDHFMHRNDVELIRQLKRMITPRHDDHWVTWYCPSLGGGNAGLSYWLNVKR